MASSFIGGGIWTPSEDSTNPHTTVTERPAPIEPAKPPASNSGSDDPTGGIGQGAGGLSKTAAIGSPVPDDAGQQTVVGSVLESVFGKKERSAADVDAAAPTSATVTAGSSGTSATTAAETNSSSGTYLGAIAGAVGAGGAAVASIIPGMTSTTGAEPHAATPSSTATVPVEERSVTGATATEPVGGASTTHEPVTGTSGESLGYKPSTAVLTEDTPVTTSSSTPADVKSSTAGLAAEDTTTSSTPADVKSSTAAVTEDKPITEKSTTATEDKTLGEKASETAESAKATANEAATSAANTATAAGESVKEAVTGESKKDDTTEESEESHEKAKKVSDHEAAVRTNPDAIPTAGGEKLGAAHAGESKIIPDVPPKQDETPAVSSTAGQPDSTTANNTAKNAGDGHTHPLDVLGHKQHEGLEDTNTADKPKFMNRLKNKLHIGKDKA